MGRHVEPSGERACSQVGAGRRLLHTGSERLRSCRHFPELVSDPERQMTRTPRGLSGSVAGIPASEVTDILVTLVTKIQAKHGLSYKRHEANATLCDMGYAHRSTERKGLVRALDTLPGMYLGSNGDRMLPPDPVALVTHREFRLLLGQADIADIATLYRLLADAGSLTPQLTILRDRYLHALVRILGADWYEKL